MPLFSPKKYAKITIGLTIVGCLGLSVSPKQIAYAQAELTYKKYLYGTTSRSCGYPGYRFDMNKIFETAKKYPNPEIIIVTPQERRQIENEIRDWNMQGKQPRLGMDPCSTCSSEYEACVVYKIFEGGVVDETRPPLEGGVEYEEPDGGETRPPVKGRVEQSEGICQRYGADINPFEGRLHVVPKTAQGPRYYCWVSFPNWRLLGEDGNYCCYFAPHEWVVKVPPMPGKPTPKPKTKPTPKSTSAPTQTPTPTPSPSPTPTPTQHCSNQVEVLSFSAKPRSGLVPDFHIHQGLLALSLNTGSQIVNRAIQGITFEARVRVNHGPIPVNDINIRFIQNVLRWDGTIFINPGPNWRAALRCGSLPILDVGRIAVPPDPFYLVGFQETGDALRTVIATDNPHLDNIVVLHPDGAQTRRIDVEAFYTMYLGCVVGDNASTFETLSTIDWRVRYKGNVIAGPPWGFQPEWDARITTAPALKSNRIPIMHREDTFNRCQGFQ